MLRLGSPGRQNMADYDKCVTHREVSTQRLLVNSRNAIQQAYIKYAAGAGKAGKVVPILPNAPLKKAWQTNYTLLDKNGPLSDLREALFRNNGSGRCVFCACITAGTLDHYLPQNNYSEFSAFAPNLVPACDPCQRHKGTKAGHRPAFQFLHAYFDHLPDVEILRTRLQVSSSGAFLLGYFIDMNANCDGNLLAQMAYQFKTLDLDVRYRQEAAIELGDRREAVAQLFDAAGPQRVREYLRLEAASVRHERGLHSWKTALLTALANENSFPDSAIPAFLGR